MKLNTIGRAVVVSIAAAVAVATAATPALADPPAGDFRQLAGTGSDTIQDLMNALGATIGGGTVVASYDARPPTGGSDTVKTRATDCEFSRPNGSGNGRKALRASEGEDIGGGVGVWPGDSTGVNIEGCVDFARSSSYGGTTAQSSGNYTYIPAGVDAVTLGVNEGSDLPFTWSFAQIQRVYKCFDKTVANQPVVPRMIQPGSGTWEFWTQPDRMNITENEIALGDYDCLTDANGQPLFPRVQEHDGTVLEGNLNHVIPFSAAQFVAQSNKATIESVIPGVTVADRRGPVHPVGVSTTTQPVTQPVVGGVLNINFPVPLRRDVYNVVPTDKLGDATIASTFVGTDSAACSQTVTVGGQQRKVTELLGFGIRTTFNSPLEANCGYTNLRFDS